MKRRVADLLLTALAVFVLQQVGAALLAVAGTLTIPHTFQAGATLPASWLNDNFAAVKASANNISSGQLVDGAVITQKLAPQAVTTAKLLDGAVTTPKLADQAVSTAKIQDGAVGTAQLLAAGVTGDKIRAFTIIAGNLVPQATVSARLDTLYSNTGQTLTGTYATLLASGNLTTHGGLVHVHACATVTSTFVSGNPNAQLVLVRDGSVQLPHSDTVTLTPVVMTADATSGQTVDNVCIALQDAPTTLGIHTYALQGRRTGVGTAQVGSRFLDVWEGT